MQPSEGNSRSGGRIREAKLENRMQVTERETHELETASEKTSQNVERIRVDLTRSTHILQTVSERTNQDTERM